MSLPAHSHKADPLLPHHIPPGCLDRDRADQRGDDPGSGLVGPARVHAHLVHSDPGDDVAAERQHVAVAPVLVDDVELERVAADPEVLQRPVGIGIVAPPAGEAEQPVAGATYGAGGALGGRIDCL